ncbi:AAA family ATPase [Rhodococcus sp. MS13]|nr:AAA family ATPase [Rhodococcus sp. MS13]
MAANAIALCEHEKPPHREVTGAFAVGANSPTTHHPPEGMPNRNMRGPGILERRTEFESDTRSPVTVYEIVRSVLVISATSESDIDHAVRDEDWNTATERGRHFADDDCESCVIIVPLAAATVDYLSPEFGEAHPRVVVTVVAGELGNNPWECFRAAGLDIDCYSPLSAWVDDADTCAEFTEDHADELSEVPDFSTDSASPTDAAIDTDSTAEDGDAFASDLSVLDWRKRSEPRPEREWLEDRLIAVGQVTKITAASGVGKTLLLAHLALNWSLGRSGLDVEDGKPRLLARPLRTLYIDGEVGEDWWFEYLDKMAAPLELPNLLVKSFPDWAPLTGALGAAQFWELVEHLEPDVVVLDTLSSFIDGDENDSTTWIKFDNRITLPLKARGVSVIFADHTGKNAELGARGSSAKKSKIDVEWSAESSPKGSNGLLLRNLKARTGRLPETVRLLRKDGPLTHVRSGSDAVARGPLRLATEDGTPADEKVLEIVRVLDELNIDPKSGRPTIAKRLRSEGLTASDEAIRVAIEHRRSRAGES